MTPASKFLLCAGAASLIVLVGSQAPAEAQTIQACANPAGQLRLVGSSDSCRPQETPVTWNAAGVPGPAGPAGAKGDPGDPDPGVTGGSDRGPLPPNGPAPLSNTAFALTTNNIGTGFPTYMVWANVAVEFNTGDVGAGTLPSPSAASCALVYTVNGGPQNFVDGRSVAFPITAIGAGTNRVVRMNIGVNGMIGTDPAVPVLPTDVVDVTLNCSSNAGPTPPPGTIPVKAVSYSLSGIGVDKHF